MKLKGSALEGSIVKMFTEDEQARIIETLGATDGALLLFQSGPAETVNKVLAFLRDRVGTENGLKTPGTFSAFYVLDFPAIT